MATSHSQFSSSQSIAETRSMLWTWRTLLPGSSSGRRGGNHRPPASKAAIISRFSSARHDRCRRCSCKLCPQSNLWTPSFTTLRSKAQIILRIRSWRSACRSDVQADRYRQDEQHRSAGLGWPTRWPGSPPIRTPAQRIADMESTSTRVRHRRLANASGHNRMQPTPKNRSPAKEKRSISSLLGYDVVARCSRGGAKA